MRKLATIRKIDALTPIEGADAIECATIGGWKVVVKKIVSINKCTKEIYTCLTTTYSIRHIVTFI
jgi:hypothetical protein